MSIIYSQPPESYHFVLYDIHSIEVPLLFFNLSLGVYPNSELLPLFKCCQLWSLPLPSPPGSHGRVGAMRGGDPVMHLNTCGQQSGLWLPISRPTLRMASMHRTWAVCNHTPCSFPICSSFCSTFNFTVPERHSLK